MVAGLALASCDSGSYEDWADPLSSAQEDAQTVTLSVSPASAIDFASVTADSVQLFVPTLTAEEGATTTYEVVMYNEAKDASTTITTTAEGMVATADLQTAYYGLVGRNPISRTLDLDVTGYTDIDGTSIKTTASTTATLTADAPIIASMYYITGGINDWSNTNTDYPVENGGGDVYDDPIFTITLTSDQVGTGFEFKLTPVDGLGGDWSGCITAAVDGTEGKLADSNAGGNLSVTAVDGASIYILEFDMLNQTWSVTTQAFTQYIYEIGSSGNWSTTVPLASPNYDGYYKGFDYLSGEFKFKPQAGSSDWSGDWGQDPSGDYGTLVVEGESNCWYNDGEGYYMMEVDLVSMTYTLTKINTISLIGSAVNGDSSWSTDYDMTYNVTDGTWDFTGELTAGEFKFRANYGWDINWGGTTDNLVQGGDNITIATAGTYTIKLKALCDGYASYTIE